MLFKKLQTILFIIITGAIGSILGAVVLEKAKAEFTTEIPIKYLIAACGLGVTLMCAIAYWVARSLEKARFQARAEKYHKFIHRARDLAISNMTIRPPVSSGTSPQVPATGVSKHIADQAKVEKLLSQMVEVFKDVLPHGTNVWACIRELRTDDKFYTWARSTGNYNVNRAMKSKPVAKDSELFKSLRDDAYNGVECVRISGSWDPLWTALKIDDFDEINSVIMGAILAKDPIPNTNATTNPEMHWIVFLCSDSKKCFNESHKNLMKCCTDVFSWLLNVYARL